MRWNRCREVRGRGAQRNSAAEVVKGGGYGACALDCRRRPDRKVLVLDASTCACVHVYVYYFCEIKNDVIITAIIAVIIGTFYITILGFFII